MGANQAGIDGHVGFQAKLSEEFLDGGQIMAAVK